MNNILSALEAQSTELNPADMEYVGEDGLLYCSKCNTRKQTRLVLMGRERIFSCLCKCGTQERDAQIERTKEQERRIYIDHLKSNGIQQKELYQCTFDVAEDSETIRIARRYAEHWEEMKKRKRGLLFWGDVGTGKTFAAACIGNALLEQGVPVLMTNFSKLINQIGPLYAEDRNNYIASLSSYDLLIIDDLGIERSTEFAQEQVYTVVDERCQSGKPMIVTTNLSLDEMNDPADISHDRIYSRILRQCDPVLVEGSDRRRKEGMDAMEEDKKLLSDPEE